MLESLVCIESFEFNISILVSILPRRGNAMINKLMLVRDIANDVWPGQL